MVLNTLLSDIVLSVQMYTCFVILANGDTIIYGERLNYESFMAFRTAGITSFCQFLCIMWFQYTQAMQYRSRAYNSLFLSHPQPLLHCLHALKPRNAHKLVYNITKIGYSVPIMATTSICTRSPLFCFFRTGHETTLVAIVSASVDSKRHQGESDHYRQSYAAAYVIESTPSVKSCCSQSVCIDHT